MAILSAIINALIVLTCLFLICLILIQRGKGGGLAGAFGGVGGSSAFGTKSGDVFTRVTMIVASVWIVLSMISVVLYNQGGQSAWGNDASASASKEVAPKAGKTATGTTTTTTNSDAKTSKTTTETAPAPLPSEKASTTEAPAIPDMPFAPDVKK